MVLQDSCEVEIAGQRITLLAHRCAYWHEAATLLLSDLHLGKLETIASAGVPMPVGLLESELARLEAACARVRAMGHAIRRILVLGDFLHARIGATDQVCDAFARAKRSMGDVPVHVIPGNHDRALARLAAQLDIHLLPSLVVEGPFAFTHDATHPAHQHAILWSGHLHPAVLLGPRRHRLKLPAFLVGPRDVLLPAFSSFTSGVPLDPAGRDVYALAPDAIIKVPQAQGSRVRNTQVFHHSFPTPG